MEELRQVNSHTNDMFTIVILLRGAKPPVRYKRTICPINTENVTSETSKHPETRVNVHACFIDHQRCDSWHLAREHFGCRSHFSKDRKIFFQMGGCVMKRYSDGSKSVH